MLEHNRPVELIKRETYNRETLGMSEAAGSYIPEAMGKSKAFAAVKQANANRGWKKEKSGSYNLENMDMRKASRSYNLENMDMGKASGSYNLENMDMRKASGSFQQGPVEMFELYGGLATTNMFEEHNNLEDVSMPNAFSSGLFIKHTTKERWRKLSLVVRFVFMLRKASGQRDMQ